MRRHRDGERTSNQRCWIRGTSRSCEWGGSQDIDCPSNSEDKCYCTGANTGSWPGRRTSDPRPCDRDLDNPCVERLVKQYLPQLSDRSTDRGYPCYISPRWKFNDITSHRKVKMVYLDHMCHTRDVLQCHSNLYQTNYNTRSSSFSQSHRSKHCAQHRVLIVKNVDNGRDRSHDPNLESALRLACKIHIWRTSCALVMP